MCASDLEASRETEESAGSETVLLLEEEIFYYDFTLMNIIQSRFVRRKLSFTALPCYSLLDVEVQTETRQYRM